MTEEKNIYVPNLENGEKIYKKVSFNGGIDLDYTLPKKIPYTWDDFTDLVKYERENNISPHYSALMAINLMKGRLCRMNYHYESKSLNTQKESLIMFLNDNYMKVFQLIPSWDYTTGTYFDTYYKLWIHDALRATSKSGNSIEDSYSLSSYKEYDDNTDDKTIDSVEYSLINSTHAYEKLNIDDYLDAESLLIKKEQNTVNDLLFNSINSKTIFTPEMKKTFAFLSKFLDAEFLENINSVKFVAPILKDVFYSVEKEVLTDREKYIIRDEYTNNYEDNFEEYNDDYDLNNNDFNK